jgi:hypothetical protein
MPHICYDLAEREAKLVSVLKSPREKRNHSACKAPVRRTRPAWR